MINALPIIGWLLSIGVNISLAVPFWFLWTVCGLGRAYFDFVPAKYQYLPFWHCVGLFIVISILKCVLVPKLATVSHECNREKK
jgi:hypothetical protein